MTRLRSQRTHQRLTSNRSAAALIEFAICLPMLVLIILGSIEASSSIFIRQSMIIAAYEAAREAVRPDGNRAEAFARANNVLTQRNIRSSTVQISPSNSNALQGGEEITVEITAGLRANSLFFGRVIQDRTIRVSTTMVRD